MNRHRLWREDRIANGDLIAGDPPNKVLLPKQKAEVYVSTISMVWTSDIYSLTPARSARTQYGQH